MRTISLKAVKDARFVREAIELAVLREAIARHPYLDFFAMTRELIAGSRATAVSNDLERFLW